MLLSTIAITLECNVLEELEPIDFNLNYDFNFQQFTQLQKPHLVLPVSNIIGLSTVLLDNYNYTKFMLPSIDLCGAHRCLLGVK